MKDEIREALNQAADSVPVRGQVPTRFASQIRHRRRLNIGLAAGVGLLLIFSAVTAVGALGRLGGGSAIPGSAPSATETDPSPSPSISPSPSLQEELTEEQVQEFVTGFIQARVAGADAEAYLSAEAASDYGSNRGLSLYDRPNIISGHVRDVARLGQEFDVSILLFGGSGLLGETLRVGPGTDINGNAAPIIALSAISGTTPSCPDDAPEAVCITLSDLVRAVRRADLNGLSALTGAEFVYSTQDPPGPPPIEYWEALGDAGIAKLDAILQMPAVLDSGSGANVYTWPFFISSDLQQLTELEQSALKSIATDEEFTAWTETGVYLGLRTGIRDDGTWMLLFEGAPPQP